MLQKSARGRRAICYVPLHNHSEYSFFDGFSTPEEMAARAKEIGAPAIAITDHGTLNGVVKFVQACNKYGVKPILGVEAYWVPDMSKKDKDEERNHLVLWAANDEGYRNLLKLVSLGATDGLLRLFYGEFPRIDDSLLEKYGKGLIASSSCLAGRIPRLLLQERRDEAKEVAEYYSKIFDHFVLEIQPQAISEQYTVNFEILELAERTGLPVVVTTDSHYSCQSDAIYQDLLLAIQDKKLVNDPNRFRMSGEATYWIQDADSIMESLKINYYGRIIKPPRHLIDEALNNTLWVAEQCNATVELGRNRFPHFPTPEGQSEEELFRNNAESGLFSWMIEKEIADVEKYQERLKSELDVIAGKEYSGYFLIVSDIVQYGKEQGWAFGPGRGSAGGCLTSSALNITSIDPVKHGLIFERFLNPARPSPPDIDIDVADDKRDQLIEYVRQKYGADRVAQIANATTMGPKDALKRVAKAYGIPHAEINRITKLITAKKLEEETNPIVVEFLQKHPQIRDGAFKMQNRVIGRGIHAAGIVIAPDTITNFVALQMGKDGEIVTQADKDDIEALGLLKIDLLGLKTLGVLDHALRLANDPDFTWETLWNMDYDDPAIYEVLNSGRTEAVFQVESDLMKRIIKEVKPTQFSDIVAILSLGRPGPMQMITPYAARKHKREPVRYLHPALEPILKETYGIFVYQEQVIRAATDLAGYSLEDADLLRRGIGKKDHDVMAAEHKRFVEGCQKVSGIPADIAEEIWNQIVTFADYGFNKSHAVGYAMITCWTAYVKYHKPAAFWTAVLSNEVHSNAKDRDEKILIYANEARRDGVKFLCPDVNKSEYWFKLEGNAIRWGLSGIKGLGRKASESLIDLRPIQSLNDLIERADSNLKNKTRMRALALVGALDNLEDTKGLSRNEIWNMICDWRKANKFRVEDGEYIQEYSKSDQIRDEQQLLGISITYQSAWGMTKEGQEITIKGEIIALRPHKDKNSNDMAFLTIRTEEGDKISAVCFSSVYSNAKRLLKLGKEVVITGRRQGTNLIIDYIAKDQDESFQSRPLSHQDIIVNPIFAEPVYIA